MRKGFQNLTLEQRKLVSSKGGKAVYIAGTGHLWTSEEAVKAGRKGGLKRKKK